MEMEADFFREKAHREKGFLKSTFVIRVDLIPTSLLTAIRGWKKF